MRSVEESCGVTREEFVGWLAQSREESGVPATVEDPETLRRIAVITKHANDARAGTRAS